MEPAVVVRIHPGQSMLLAIRHRFVSLAWVFLLGFGGLLAPPGGLTGQEAPLQADKLLARARRAQRTFESNHRRFLPRGEDRSGGDCDERIGRLCLTNGDLDWEPTEEDPRIVEAREELLAVLEEAGRALPENRWILAQRIRYLGDTGRWEEAEALARGYPDREGWWRWGLLGYVLHRSGDVEGSLDAFSRALEAMRPEKAGEWRDPSFLLEYPAREWLENPRELSTEEALDRFWALADPLFLTPGNERLSEHYARRFAGRLYEGSSLTMQLPWGGSFEQLLLRYGFVAGWEQVPAGMHEVGIRKVVEHHHPESRGLLPPFEALEDPGGLPEGVWLPRDERPRTASAPVRAPLIAHGSAQTALLRRDAKLLVVAAYGVPADTVLHRRRPSPVGVNGEFRTNGRSAQGSLRRPPWEPDLDGLSTDTLAGLFLLPDTGSREPLGAMGEGGEGVLQLTVPPGRYLVSVEQWSPTGRWGARVRHGVEGEVIPPDIPHLSDLLLLDSEEGLPLSLSEALPRLRPHTQIRSQGRVTVAWEVYGLGLRREPLIFKLSLVEEGESFIRRALEKIGLFRKDPALTLSWVEEGPDRLGPLFRAMDVDLPSLEPGRYVLRLEMEIPYRSPVVANRRIAVS